MGSSLTITSRCKNMAQIFEISNVRTVQLVIKAKFARPVKWHPIFQQQTEWHPTIGDDSKRLSTVPRLEIYKFSHNLAEFSRQLFSVDCG